MGGRGSRPHRGTRGRRARPAGGLGRRRPRPGRGRPGCRGLRRPTVADYWNLSLTYGLDVADEFRRVHRSLAGVLDDEVHWDLVTAVDVLVDLDPTEWSRFDLDRVERYLHGELADAA